MSDLNQEGKTDQSEPVESEESSHEDEKHSLKESNEYRNLDIMIDKKLLILNELPIKGGRPVQAYGTIMMSPKLYNPTFCLEVFIESKLVTEWKLTNKWTTWASGEDLESKIEKASIRKDVKTEVEQNPEWDYQITAAAAVAVFNKYDGLKSRGDILTEEDRAFLHFPGQFGIITAENLQTYVTEAGCVNECARLIEKFSKDVINTEVIRKSFPP